MKHTSLRDQRTRDLRSLLVSCVVFAGGCAPLSERGRASTWLALAFAIDDELRFRNPRRSVHPLLRSS